MAFTTFIDYVQSHYGVLQLHFFFFLLCVFRIVVEEEQKQVQQLEAALLELGREHQTLQVNALCHLAVSFNDSQRTIQPYFFTKPFLDRVIGN